MASNTLAIIAAELGDNGNYGDLTAEEYAAIAEQYGFDPAAVARWAHIATELSQDRTPEYIRKPRANEMFGLGAMLEPVSWSLGQPDNDGRVDFDNDEEGTELTVSAFPSTIEKGVMVVQIDACLARRIKVVVNDGTVWVGDTE